MGNMQFEAKNRMQTKPLKPVRKPLNGSSISKK